MDLPDRVRAALWMVLLFTAQGDLVGARRLMRAQRGLKPSELRAAVLAAGGEMTGYPSEDLLAEFEPIGVDESVVTIRCPLWTTAGRSPLRLDVDARIDGRDCWFDFVQLVDEQGRPVVTSDAATVPTVPAEQPHVVDGDLRLPRQRYVAPRPDLRVLLLVERVEQLVPDWAGRLDELDADHRALVVIDRFMSAVYGDGLPAAYRDLPIDDLGRRLVEACTHIGAPAFADLFRRIDATGAARAAEFEEEFNARDEGNALHARLCAHIDDHPDAFLR